MVDKYRSGELRPNPAWEAATPDERYGQLSALANSYAGKEDNLHPEQLTQMRFEVEDSATGAAEQQGEDAQDEKAMTGVSPDGNAYGGLGPMTKADVHKVTEEEWCITGFCG